MLTTQLLVIVGAAWGILGTTMTVANVGGVVDLPLQYGALGILAIMIWVNFRERQATLDRFREERADHQTQMDDKDKRVYQAFERSVRTSDQLARAIDDLRGVVKEMVRVTEVCRIRGETLSVEEQKEDACD